MLFLLHEISVQWSSFTAEMKNQPGDKCFACKQASSSPRALYPASKEHWEAPSSLHFLRGSKSLWILFHGLQLNQFFVFGSIPTLMEGQCLLHFGSTGCVKIWKGRLLYCLVPARMCSLHYARGLQLCGLEFQSWPTSSWHEAEQPHCHSCFKEAYLCCYTWQPRKAMQTQ